VFLRKVSSLGDTLVTPLGTCFLAADHQVEFVCRMGKTKIDKPVCKLLQKHIFKIRRTHTHIYIYIYIYEEFRFKSL